MIRFILIILNFIIYLRFFLIIIRGIVAQMVERLLSMQEAAGSMPASSIFLTKLKLLLLINSIKFFTKYHFYKIISTLIIK